MYEYIVKTRFKLGAICPAIKELESDIDRSLGNIGFIEENLVVTSELVGMITSSRFLSSDEMMDIIGLIEIQGGELGLKVISITLKE